MIVIAIALVMFYIIASTIVFVILSIVTIECATSFMKVGVVSVILISVIEVIFMAAEKQAIPRPCFPCLTSYLCQAMTVFKSLGKSHFVPFLQTKSTTEGGLTTACTGFVAFRHRGEGELASWSRLFWKPVLRYKVTIFLVFPVVCPWTFMEGSRWPTW